MYVNLTKKGVRIPNGFCVTADAYRFFVESAGLIDGVREHLKGLDTTNVTDLAERGHAIRSMIRHAEMPMALKAAIEEAYGHLCKQYGPKVDVAVRSSATAEDLPNASFAGQQETFLNIKGVDELLDACRKCFASLFTNRAISYRVDKGFDHFKVALSIGVQKMVRSDMACSGVMFTIDTETGFKDSIVINGAYGLGENVVQGAVNPDEFIVFKPTLKAGFKPLLTKRLGEKSLKMIYAMEGDKPTKNVETAPEDRKHFVLSDEEVLSLARWGAIIEDHYTNKKGKFCPMDIEWAKDGQSNELYIVQARPETVQSQRDMTKLETYVLKEQGKVLAQGASVGDKIGAGKANIIKNAKDIDKFRKGQVLVTDMTDPDWEPIMKIAAAIVTNRGEELVMRQSYHESSASHAWSEQTTALKRYRLEPQSRYHAQKASTGECTRASSSMKSRRLIYRACQRPGRRSWSTAETRNRHSSCRSYRILEWGSRAKSS